MSREAKAWIKINKLLNIGKNMDTIMDTIEKNNLSLKGVFPKLMKGEVSTKGVRE